MKTFLLTTQRPGDISVGERLQLQMLDMILWSADEDRRVSVLMTLLAEALTDVIDNNDAEQVEAILDALRMQLVGRPS